MMPISMAFEAGVVAVTIPPELSDAEYSVTFSVLRKAAFGVVYPDGGGRALRLIGGSLLFALAEGLLKDSGPGVAA